MVSIKLDMILRIIKTGNVALLSFLMLFSSVYICETDYIIAY